MSRYHSEKALKNDVNFDDTYLYSFLRHAALHIVEIFNIETVENKFYFLCSSFCSALRASFLSVCLAF